MFQKKIPFFLFSLTLLHCNQKPTEPPLTTTTEKPAPLRLLPFQKISPLSKIHFLPTQNQNQSTPLPPPLSHPLHQPEKKQSAKTIAQVPPKKLDIPQDFQNIKPKPTQPKRHTTPPRKVPKMVVQKKTKPTSLPLSLPPIFAEMTLPQITPPPSLRTNPKSPTLLASAQNTREENPKTTPPTPPKAQVYEVPNETIKNNQRSPSGLEKKQPQINHLTNTKSPILLASAQNTREKNPKTTTPAPPKAQVYEVQNEMMKNAQRFTSWVEKEQPQITQLTQQAANIPTPTLPDAEETAFQDPLALSAEETISSESFCAHFANTLGESIPDLQVSIPGTHWETQTDRNGLACFEEVPSGSSFFLLVEDLQNHYQKTFFEASFEQNQKETSDYLLEHESFHLDLAQTFQYEHSLHSTGLCAWFQETSLKGWRIQAPHQTTPLSIGYLNDLGLPDPEQNALSESGGFCVFNLKQSFFHFELVNEEGSQTGPIWTTYLYPGVFRLFDFFPTARLEKPVNHYELKHVSQITGFRSQQDLFPWKPFDSGWTWQKKSSSHENFSLGQKFTEITSSDDKKFFSFLSRSHLLEKSQEQDWSTWTSQKPLSLFSLSSELFNKIQKKLQEPDPYLEMNQTLGFVLIDLSESFLKDQDVKDLKISCWDVSGTRNLFFQPEEVNLEKLSPRRSLKIFARVLPGQHTLKIENKTGEILSLQLIRSSAKRMQILAL